MNINFTFAEDDFVTYQTYIFQKSFQYRKNQIINGFLLPILCIVAGIALLNTTYQLFAIAAFVAGAGLFLVRPMVEKKSSVEHFKKWYNENFHQKIKKISLQIENDCITESDTKKKTSTEFETKEIDSIIEVSSHIFIKFKNGISFVVPKDKLKELETFKKTLHAIANSLDVLYIDDSKWRLKL